MGVAVKTDLDLFFNPGTQKVLPSATELTALSIRNATSDGEFSDALLKIDQVVAKTIPIVLEILRGEAPMVAEDRVLFSDLGTELSILELSAPDLFATARAQSYGDPSKGAANTPLGALCRAAVMRDRIVGLLRVGR